MVSVYKAMRRRLLDRYYATKDEAIEDTNKLLNKGHLTQEEYDDLMELIEEIYRE